MDVVEAIDVALEVAKHLERLGVAYLIGGGVATSILGEARHTEDVDMVADLRPEHARRLVAEFNDDFTSPRTQSVAAARQKK